MSDTSTIAAMRVSELIVQIGSNHVAPGAGAAGAVALSLAAACAAKACAISLKHRIDDAVIKNSLECFTEIGSHALADADRDVEAFKDFIRLRSGAAAHRLLDTGTGLGRLIETFMALVDDVEPRIDAAMAGDIEAAKALAVAARVIQQNNTADAQRAESTAIK